MHISACGVKFFLLFFVILNAARNVTNHHFITSETLPVQKINPSFFYTDERCCH